jgi:DNA-directed RNA polymerase specialized sigma24 family protein
MQSPEAFETFLLWLGQDSASGAHKYEEVRRKLILLFNCRGCPIPEELADETIDRTARVVLRPDFTYVGDPIAYFRGVARNVFFEWERKQRKFATVPVEEDAYTQPQSSQKTESETEVLSAYLETCLNQLPADKRSLLVRYYQSEKRAKIDARQVLAEKEGIGLNALRIQVFRLRNAVRQCIEAQIRESETQWPITTFHE